MKITLAKLYSRVREDGAVVLAGRFGWNGEGMLRILPADDYNPDDPKSAPFVAVFEQAPPKNPPRYQGQQIASAPRQQHRALGRGYDFEGEVVDG